MRTLSLAGTSRERPLLITHSNGTVFVGQCTSKESLPPCSQGKCTQVKSKKSSPRTTLRFSSGLHNNTSNDNNNNNNHNHNHKDNETTTTSTTMTTTRTTSTMWTTRTAATKTTTTHFKSPIMLRPPPEATCRLESASGDAFAGRSSKAAAFSWPRVFLGMDDVATGASRTACVMRIAVGVERTEMEA